MIFTECPSCDYPFRVLIDNDHLLQWARVVCDKCGKPCHVEMRRFDGRTLNQEAFDELAARSVPPDPA